MYKSVGLRSVLSNAGVVQKATLATAAASPKPNTNPDIPNTGVSTK